MAFRQLKINYPQGDIKSATFKLFGPSTSEDIKNALKARFHIPCSHRLLLLDPSGVTIIIDNFIETGDYELQSFEGATSKVESKFAAERRSAIEAVRKASLVCQAVQDVLVKNPDKATLSATKDDTSPVTVADFAAQALVILQLSKDFSSKVNVVGEEEAKDLKGEKNRSLRESVLKYVRQVEPKATDEQILAAIDGGKFPGGATGTHWALDPIDGTKGFLRLDQYAIALGLIKDGKVVFGVLGCPNLPVAWADRESKTHARGVLFVGEPGVGSYAIPLSELKEGVEAPAGKRISVSEITDASKASFVESLEAGHSDHAASQKIAKLLGMTGSTSSIKMDSQAKYAALARGDAPIYLRLPTRKGYQEKIWDHAAGVAVIEAAGGRVTDVFGKPLDFSLGRTLKNNEGVVATNGKLHDQVISVVSKVIKELQSH